MPQDHWLDKAHKINCAELYMEKLNEFGINIAQSTRESKIAR